MPGGRRDHNEGGRLDRLIVSGKGAEDSRALHDRVPPIEMLPDGHVEARATAAGRIGAYARTSPTTMRQLRCRARQEKTIVLANTATRLKRLEPVVQERLINWGYAICDAAMRKWVDASLAPPSGFPYPASGIG